ncbi:MAG: GTP cyclohydrolase I FolE [Microbacteriaceae bacterium]|nr:GTP cyclohydrolase I FolE [Microbacteriaceae bacterium]MDR9443950.1 GTP cyclohydrolase I FolE [Microbacteriaceae bacterium]
MDTERIKQAVRELLAAIGEDPNRDELADTPEKVSESYQEFFKGIGVDPVDYLQESFPADSTELVMLKDIELVSICEHHLLPFTGVAHVAFLPDEKIIGLGRIAKVVEVLASRPQLQENLGNQIADAINQGLSPKGVLVVVEAKHQCVASRGARQPEVNTLTTSVRGLMESPEYRQEAMGLISK